MLSETLCVMNFAITSLAEAHVAFCTPNFYKLFTSVTLLGLASIISINSLEELRVCRAQLFYYGFPARTGTGLLVLISAHVADEQFAAACQQLCLRFSLADFALEHLSSNK